MFPEYSLSHSCIGNVFHQGFCRAHPGSLRVFADDAGKGTVDGELSRAMFAIETLPTTQPERHLPASLSRWRPQRIAGQPL
jgi:hypothetical protein